MKKNAKRARLQSIDNAQLAQVTGGNVMLSLAGKFAEHTGWHEFFYAAYEGSGGCGSTCGYSSTPVP